MLIGCLLVVSQSGYSKRSTTETYKEVRGFLLISGVRFLLAPFSFSDSFSSSFIQGQITFVYAGKKKNKKKKLVKRCADGELPGGSERTELTGVLG